MTQVRCPHCDNLVGEVKNGLFQMRVSVRKGKRGVICGDVRAVECEKCGKTFRPSMKLPAVAA